MKIFLAILVLAVLALTGLQVLRWNDGRVAARTWAALGSDCLGACGAFDPAMLEGLPPPVQRYFTYAIKPGTPLRTVALIEMEGEIGLGTKDAPNYQPMRARQILAPPKGLVWEVEAGSGPLRITGSDGAFGDQSWTRFWLAGTVPVVRASGPDHAQSAFGRVVAEAAFWSPAALLPQQGMDWAAYDEELIEGAIVRGDYRQIVRLRIAANGQPKSVWIQRWSNANPDKVFRLQPFGGLLSDFREVDGFMVPMVIEGGNFFETEDYFPFYKVRVTDIRFPGD